MLHIVAGAVSVLCPSSLDLLTVYKKSLRREGPAIDTF